jgi:uncharacterized membrane protein
LSDMDRELRGVKGWLLLLCMLLTIFDPSIALVNLFVISDGARASYDHHPEVFRLILIGGILGIILAVFSMYAGLSLWKRVPNAVKTARLYLIALAFFSVLVVFLPTLLGVSSDSQGAASQVNLLNALLSIVYVAVWYSYLGRSKRVRATYGQMNDQVDHEGD